MNTKQAFTRQALTARSGLTGSFRCSFSESGSSNTRLFRQKKAQSTFLQTPTFHLINAVLHLKNIANSWQALSRCALQDFRLILGLFRPRLMSFLNLLQRLSFELEEWNKDSDEYKQWIFGKDNISIDEMPEQTSLQRKAKALLRRGGKIGTAQGFLKSF